MYILSWRSMVRFPASTLWAAVLEFGFNWNFVCRRYPATLLIPMVDVTSSPYRKCNINIYDTAQQPIYLRFIMPTSLVLVHADYLFCNWHFPNKYYGTTIDGMPESFISIQIIACVVDIRVLGPQFMVSSEGLGPHKELVQTVTYKLCSSS